MSTCLTLCIVLLSPAAPAPAAAEPVPNPALEQFWREALKNVTDDESFNEVASMLGRIGPEAADAIPALLDELHSARPYRQQAACKALGMLRLERDSVLPALVRLFAADDYFVRSAARDAAARFGPAAESLLTRALDAPSADARIAAAHALWGATGKTDKVLPVLLAAMKDKDERVRREAMWALGNMGPAASAAVPALAAAMSDPRPRQRVHAAFNLWKVEGKTERVIPTLNRALEEKDEDAMADLFGLLSQMRGAARGTTPALLKLCEEADISNHVNSLSVLYDVEADPKAALPAVRRSLHHANAVVRGNAVIALAYFGPEARADLPAVRALLKDDNPVLRCQAAITLWKMERDPGAVVVLTDGLSSPDGSARVTALNGLRIVGPDAKGALPRLREMLQKLGPQGRKNVLEIIRRIDPAAVPRRGES